MGQMAFLACSSVLLCGQRHEHQLLGVLRSLVDELPVIKTTLKNSARFVAAIVPELELGLRHLPQLRHADASILREQADELARVRLRIAFGPCSISLHGREGLTQLPTANRELISERPVVTWVLTKLRHAHPGRDDAAALTCRLAQEQRVALPDPLNAARQRLDTLSIATFARMRDEQARGPGNIDNATRLDRLPELVVECDLLLLVVCVTGRKSREGVDDDIAHQPSRHQLHDLAPHGRTECHRFARDRDDALTG